MPARTHLRCGVGTFCARGINLTPGDEALSRISQMVLLGFLLDQALETPNLDTYFQPESPYVDSDATSRKESIMNSRFAASPSENAAPTTSRTRRRRGSLGSMSEKQTQAYLLARDALRRIQRTSSLLAASTPASAGLLKRSEASGRGAWILASAWRCRAGGG